MRIFIQLWLAILLLLPASAAQAQSITDLRARVENVTANVTQLYCSVFYPQQGYAAAAVGFRYGNPNSSSTTGCGAPTARSGVQITPAQPGAFTAGQYIPIATITDFNNPVYVGAGGPTTGPTISANVLFSIMGGPALPRPAPPCPTRSASTTRPIPATALTVPRSPIAMTGSR